MWLGFEFRERQVGRKHAWDIQNVLALRTRDTGERR